MMPGLFMPREFATEPPPAEVEFTKRMNYDELKWKSIDYSTAKARYKFKMFSDGERPPHYAIGDKEPNWLYNRELVGPPKGASFQEAPFGDKRLVRLLIDGMKQRYGMLARTKEEMK